MPNHIRHAAVALAVACLVACSGDDDGSQSAPDVYAFANQCVAVQLADGGRALARLQDGFAFDESEPASAFFMKPSGLGRYLFFDAARGYLVSDGEALRRATDLQSDIELVDDTFRSDAEWELQARAGDLVLRHVKSGGYVAADGLVSSASDAEALEIRTAAACAAFPEEETHSEGSVAVSAFEDGSLFGFVETHTHVFANFGFGGGGIFHGAPYHPLGVEHALASCEQFHGAGGRKDLFGAGFDAGRELDLNDFITALATGELPEFNHETAGWPDFTDWPSAHDSSTHQTQYYKWIERAYLGGLRLMVQYAVSNQVLCDLLGRGGFQPIRYSCNDMVAVDRQIEEAYAMQDYVDAQEGGPGRGWFRIVTSPAEAREVIGAGKLAVILGIETSHLFDCFLTPPVGFARCDEQAVAERLDEYWERGVRSLFPVHKYDNGFSAGDGDKAFIEIGNIVQSGHYSNFSPDCDTSVPTVFDRRRLSFPGLNMPRPDYFAPAPYDFSEFFVDPLAALAPFADRFLMPPDPENADQCQVAGLTDLGEFLVREMMARGMILEIDHFPRKSYRRVFEILEENDYPAAGTHGVDNDGRLYALGGVSKVNFGRCHGDVPSTVDDGFQERLRRIADNGGFPAIGFGFDLNGFAGAPGPRFGPNSVCATPQSDPVTYPFTSFAGDVTFTQPRVGNRTIDFNTEGMAHIGLVPELIEDVRRDGVTDEDLEPLFKSAEAYLRMWEKAERRGEALRAAAAR